MPEIGRFFGVDPVSEEYFSISTYQFAHNSPIWKIELEGLEGGTSTGNGKDDITTHEPVKMFLIPAVTDRLGTDVTRQLARRELARQVIQETTKRAVAQKIGGAVLNAAKGGGLVIAALLTPQMANAPAPRYQQDDEIEFTPEQQKMLDGIKNPKIDEKLRIKDLKIKEAGGEEDSPVVRFGKGKNQIEHAFRHTDELGLDRDDVMSSVTKDFEKNKDKIEDGKPLNMTIEVNGQKIQYTAYRLEDGTINIGRIHGVE